MVSGRKWGFPKIGGTFLGVPIIKSIILWGLYWGPLILGNYQIDLYKWPSKSFWMEWEVTTDLAVIGMVYVHTTMRDNALMTDCLG